MKFLKTLLIALAIAGGVLLAVAAIGPLFTFGESYGAELLPAIFGQPSPTR